ncbi:LamG-like jellyroll fold domain-containing protein [Kitasatospora sp. NPDC052868]|uniref:LamG-like jellyroll fold domain-containing protein n=1 Tax=Kitasatospora sp. NPDC052868 TaxID=3364060 RepID=UPI0037CBD54D
MLTPTRLTAPAAVVGLVLALLVPAAADARAADVKPADSQAADSQAGGAEPAKAGPLQTARSAAATSGKAVAVDALTTETSQTVANPDGTFSVTTHVQPARVRRNGVWTAIDASLAANPDGTLSPKATAAALTLSGGGGGPLATLTDRAGHRLSLTFPVALPAPMVSGDSAQYNGVLPGVDLKVSATEQGGLREVLIVHDAKAAANPALRELRLATGTSEGLAVKADETGALTVTAADGSTAFTAPRPLMWDSATAAAPAATAAPAVPAAPNARAKDLRGAAPAGSAPDTAGTAPAAAQPSSDRQPGSGAQVKPIAVRPEPGSLTLTPDAGLLTGQDTVWPLYIDPTVSPVTNGTSHFASLKEGCPGEQTYDRLQENGQGAGYQQWGPECIGLYQSFYELDTSNLTPDMVVSKSTFHLNETYAAAFDCTHTAPVALATATKLYSDASWNWHRPVVWQDHWFTTQYPQSANISHKCGNHDVAFDVTGQMQEITAGSWHDWTVGVYGNETKSSGNNDFMRFAGNPYVVTVFDIAPDAPGAISLTPGLQNPAGNGCDGNVGWIGNSGLTGAGTSDISLNAQLTTKMSGMNLRANYHVWDDMTDGGGGSPATVAWQVSPWVSNGGTVYTKLGFAVGDGHRYGWNTWADDGTLGGPSSPYCYFKTDLTAPGVPAIAPSAQFPPLGGAAPTGHAGDLGAKVVVTAADPTPAGCTLSACLSSGVSRFEYSLDTNIPTVGATSAAAVPATGGAASAEIPIEVGAADWGTHTLFVRAVDAAGNTQATVGQYSFFAPWNPAGAVKVAPGDLTGDGAPDLAATTDEGDLVLIPGNADPAAAPVIASRPADSPEGIGWNNYLITHRGTSSSTNVDDLFVLNRAAGSLYLYRNDGGTTPGHFTRRDKVTDLGADPSCPAKGSDGTWRNVRQILAPGKLASLVNAPDLITVDNNELWYYPGTKRAGCLLAAGVKIGTGDWSNTTLLAPGTVDGVPTLWARDRSSGAISTYPLTFANGVPTTSITAPASTPLKTRVKDTAGAPMCLDTENGATTAGTLAVINVCKDAGTQPVVRGTDRSIHLAGKCLDVNFGGPADGTAVQLWDCNGSGAQQWEPGPQPGTLMNSGSGKCLDIPYGMNTIGNRLVIWTCAGADNQNWTAAGALPAPQKVLPVGGGSTNSTLASPGDVNGDTYPDLYTVGAGRITRYPGVKAVDGIARFGTPTALGVVNQPTHRWHLGDTVDSVQQVSNLSLTGQAALVSDPDRGTVLSVPGAAGSMASTDKPVLDTGGSYSVSAWAYLQPTGEYSTVVAQSGSTVSSFYLQYSKAFNAWTFVSPAVDSTSPGTYPAAYASTPPAFNRWTHLVGTYDAASRAMSLYVDGRLAGTGSNPSPWRSNGPLTLGGARNGDYYPGRISDVQTWDYVLSPAAVAALDTGQPTPTQLS